MGEIEMYKITYGKTVSRTKRTGDDYSKEEHFWSETKAFSHIPDAGELMAAREELVKAVNTELCKQINGGAIPVAKPIENKDGTPSISPQVQAEVKKVLDSVDYSPEYPKPKTNQIKNKKSYNPDEMDDCPHCKGKKNKKYPLCYKCNEAIKYGR